MNVSIYNGYSLNHFMDLDKIWYRNFTLALSWLLEHLIFRVWSQWSLSDV
jgi:hypothetical protein